MNKWKTIFWSSVAVPLVFLAIFLPVVYYTTPTSEMPYASIGVVGSLIAFFVVAVPIWIILGYFAF